MSLDGICGKNVPGGGDSKCKGPEVETRLGCLKDSLGLEVWLEWVEQEGGSVWRVGDLRGGREGSRFQRATAAMAKDLGFCSE